MRQGYFITGTDTGVGKTFATVCLMHYFRQQGKTVVGMKPVASGCVAGKMGLRNDDALLIQAHASEQIAYDLINPYAFEYPIAPHLSARKAGVDIDLSVIRESFDKLQEHADVVLVEGVGGWLVPLGAENDVADMAVSIQLPVILVVAIRLGCINHARLSHTAIEASGLPCAGWIANCLTDEMTLQRENIDTIEQSITAPLLGVIPYANKADYAELGRNFSHILKV